MKNYWMDIRKLAEMGFSAGKLLTYQEEACRMYVDGQHYLDLAWELLQCVEKDCGEIDLCRHMENDSYDTLLGWIIYTSGKIALSKRICE